MKCTIEYIGKSRDGLNQYYCTTHKAFAHDKYGKKLDFCLCEHKELFNTKLDIPSNRINEICIRYENILENVIPKIIINGKEFNGVLTYDTCLLSYKDFGGVMLSRLNNISLEKVQCHRCQHYHSDNGKFAYTPHRTHLCLYCGHLFRVKKQNISNELAMIFDIPNIKLKNNLLEIKDSCHVEYNMLEGTLLVNNQNVNKILFENKKYSLVDFLNTILENEF